MNYFYYVAVCLFLIVLQTTILPFIPLFENFYDLLIPFVIYLGLFRQIREGLILVCLLGFLMDNLSGSPFGLYLTTYCWLFIGVKWIITIFQVNNRVLFSLVVAAGVLIGNGIAIGSIAIQAGEMRLPENAMQIVLIQFMWALVTGPLLLMLFRFGQKHLEDITRGLFARRGNHGA
jgi:rod shape-determining protein MreD